MAIAAWAVPGYDYTTFSKAYSYYVKEYEFGYNGINFCSSPFRLVSLLLSDFSWNRQHAILQTLLKYVFIALGSIVSVWSLWLGSTQRVKPSKSLFIFLLGNIISTPVFADYHLLVFFAPIILCLMEDQASPLSDLGGPDFTRLELVTAGILMSPKSFPLTTISGAPVTSQIILNPVLIFLYLSLFLYFSGRARTIIFRQNRLPNSRRINS